MKEFLLLAALIAVVSAGEVRLTDLEPTDAQQIIEKQDQTLKYAPKVDSNVPAVRFIGNEPQNVLEDIYLANQYHGQDGLGGYLYGYSVPDIAKTEKKKAGGDLRGAYNYIAGNGQEIKVEYWDDGTGFHQIDNVPKILPKQIEDLPEVAAAKQEHLRLWHEQAERNSRPIENPYNSAGEYASGPLSKQGQLERQQLFNQLAQQHPGQQSLGPNVQYHNAQGGSYQTSAGSYQAPSGSQGSGQFGHPQGQFGQGSGSYGLQSGSNLLAAGSQNQFSHQKPAQGQGFGQGQNQFSSGVSSGQSGFTQQGGYGGSGEAGQGQQGGFGASIGQSGQGGVGSFAGSSGQSGFQGQGAFGGSASHSGQGGVGSSGQSGYQGQGGFGGSASQSGQGGVGSFAGSSGQSGYKGQGGFGGSAGQSGQGGVGSFAGSSGQSGFQGQGGFGGSASQSGQGAVGSFSGSSGQSGHQGQGGFGGATGQTGYGGQASAQGSSSYNQAQGSLQTGYKSSSSSENTLSDPYSGQYSETKDIYSQSKQQQEEDEEEEKGPPKGFFYSFDYPVGIIVQKQGGLQGGVHQQQKREGDLKDIYATNKALFMQQLQGQKGPSSSGYLVV